MHPVRAARVVCCLVLASACLVIAQDDGTDNATDSCPPIPNCDLGYTCKVVKHPDNCPICKCVPCDNKPCLIKEGFSCRPVQQSNGCTTCRCDPCLRSPPCESPCTKSKSPVGCPICECPGTKGPLPTTAGKPEVENMPFDFQNDAENSFEP
ncbi:uncharacterized protein LOC121834827 [Ixodes scapularis]|uniref:Krtap5-1 protein, putative n=1 Tax=Ixodes scapularis TaxID=6945 RepID=B7QH31_IXOSC|nr:uncharacterized protein LOC121834827 [Ixodes scapularis]EEC18153.1 Krtap5-1 protein, putative [Ixodes scapularis]|eukprot:XP_002414488.1 Krtap5-1 protein, putative [Ixodes scapularis]